MIIYPAIDIRCGKCVRLKQGRYDDMTVFSDDPIDVALKFQDMGASFIHVVDLDGARGDADNRQVIVKLASVLDIPVQTGGGIRTLDDIKTLLESGIARVILGTAAVKDPELIARAVSMYNGSIAVGIDAKDGFVAIEGWEKVSPIKALDLAKSMEDTGVKTIIYTDIATDGMLSGPNLYAMKEMVQNVNIEVIASGGVAKVEDLLDLKQVGVHGAIVGKALYTGSVDLKEALKRLA